MMFFIIIFFYSLTNFMFKTDSYSKMLLRLVRRLSESVGKHLQIRLIKQDVRNYFKKEGNQKGTKKIVLHYV